jgi:hypothetical protein
MSTDKAAKLREAVEKIKNTKDLYALLYEKPHHNQIFVGSTGETFAEPIWEKMTEKSKTEKSGGRKKRGKNNKTKRRIKSFF